MKELFIPYTEALEMKELGFNEKCLAAYTNRGKFHQTSSDYWDNDSIKMIKKYTTIKLKVLAPLYSQAFKFFREKYKLHSYIFYCGSKPPTVDVTYDVYYYSIQDYENGFIVDTYEEAELECIKQLIKIVKNEIK